MPKILDSGKDVDSAFSIITNALGLINGKKEIIINTPIESVVILGKLLFHVVEKRLDARERFSNFIIPTLEHPFEIYSAKIINEYRNQYIGLFQGQTDILVVVSTNDAGQPILWNMMQSSKRTINKHRNGELIWAKKICSPVEESINS